MNLGNPFFRGVSMHLQGSDDGAGFGVKGTSLNNIGVLGTSNNGAEVCGSAIGVRWLKPLRHFTGLSALLAIALVVPGAQAQLPLNGFGPGETIGAVSRSTDTLDVHEVDPWGFMWHARWDLSGGWQGWDRVTGESGGIRSSSSVGPVTAVSPSTGEIDLFTVAPDNRLYTARGFNPIFFYAGWNPIGDLLAGTASYVSAVSRNTGIWDIFFTGLDGQVWTASSGWSGGPLPGVRVAENTPVAAASPVTDELAIFVVDVNGNLQSSVWAPYLGGWTSWRQIGGVQLFPSAPVTALSRAPGQLELFVVDVNRNIQTTTLLPSFSGWRSIGVAVPGAIVTGVSRHPGQLDIFVVLNQQVWTQGSSSLSASFNIGNWRAIAGLTTAEGSAVTAVSRSQDKIDVFVNGFDRNLWTAAWEPDFVQPGVSDWHVFKVPVPQGLPPYE